MDCNHGQELINLYIDQQLNQDELEDLQKHLDICDSCKADFDLYKSIQTELMNTESVELPDDFHETLMNRIKETPTKSKINMVIKQFNIAAVFVFVLVFALIGINNLNQQKSSSDMALMESTTSTETSEVAQDTMMMAVPEMTVSSDAPESTAGSTNEAETVFTEDVITSDDEVSLSIANNETERQQKSSSESAPVAYGGGAEATEEIPTIESNLKWLYPLSGGLILIFLLMSYRFLKKN